MNKVIVLRKIAGVFTACRAGFGMRMVASGAEMPLSSIAFGLCLMLIPLLAVMAMLVALVMPHGVAGIALAIAPLAVDKAKLTQLLTEAGKIQAEHAGKVMPEDVGKKFDSMMTEAKAMQDEADAQELATKREQQLDGFKRWSREVPEPTLPASPSQNGGDIAGYITPGHLAVMSEEYNRAIKGDGSFSKSAVASIDIKGSLFNKGGIIALTEAQVKGLRAVTEQMKSNRGFETKDLPVFGELVIAPQRVDRFVQDTRPQDLTLRDILTVTPTTSNLIQYVAELSYTPGAAIQSEGVSTADTAAKGEADIEYELRDAPIRTIADTIPVSEQQLADAPALINRINTRLMHGVKQKEEQLMGYGSGSGLEFAGFFDSDSDVAAATTPSGSPTLLDKIRAAVTDVKKSRYSPNFVWINPTDWETIELLKGSDGQYVWAVIRDLLGPRVWGLRVVEGTGTQKAGASTTNILVGDSMGAVLYDRQQANIAIGWVDDQFTKNLRTIRAEERMTLTIDMPAAFRYINTAA